MIDSILLTLILPHHNKNDIEEEIKEMKLLANTIGYDIKHFFKQNRLAFDPATYFGRGKIKEVFEKANLLNINTIFINDGGDKSNIDIGSNTIFKSLNNLIISSLKGNLFDDNIFIISYFRLGENYLVKFIPKDKNILDLIAVFELIFHKETNDVIEVKMIESSSDYTKIIFKNKTLNITLSDAIFNN